MDDIVRELEETKERLKQAQLESDNLELRLAEVKENLEKYQERMLTIKTNKEYDALVSQIESCKSEISQGEERYLQLMDEIDELKNKAVQLEEKSEAVRRENGEQLSTLQAEIDSVETKVDEKRAHRSQLRTKVPKPVMSIYERVRRGKGGDVVVRLRRGACGECFKSQPPQKIQEIKKGETIQTCDSCGRILIWEGDD
jgi:predicted  nucleic acid-binding Zn-ribbon protein